MTIQAKYIVVGMVLGLLLAMVLVVTIAARSGNSLENDTIWLGSATDRALPVSVPICNSTSTRLAFDGDVFTCLTD